MQGVIVRPSPGVCSAFDERGCAVVDTVHDRWFHFTGDAAWAWETVEVTGTTAHLDTPEEVESLHSFFESGLMTMETADSLTKEASQQAPLPTGGAVDMGKPGRPILYSAWIAAARTHRRPLPQILDLTREMHRTPHPYLTHSAAAHLNLALIRHAPWWVRRPVPRLLHLATAIAAGRMGARIDVSFGISHTQKTASWWCTTPEGHIGRPDDVLAVSSF